MHLRRYCLLQAVEARAAGDDGLEAALRGLQLATAGTALDPSWPGYSRLTAAGYRAREDIDGAEADELVRIAGLTYGEADAAIARLLV